MYDVHMTLTMCYKIPDAAKALGVTQVTLWRWRDEGLIRSVKVKGSTVPRVTAAEVERVLALPRNGRGIIWPEKK